LLINDAEINFESTIRSVQEWAKQIET